MRRSLLVAGAVLVASLSLAACGGSGATATTLKQFVASFGSQQYVQVKLTYAMTGKVSSVEEGVLKALSITVQAENPSGGALSAANGDANAEVLVNLGATTFADVRVVGDSLYFELDLSGLSSIPGLHLSASELAVAQAFFGGRWFEVPKSLIQSFEPPASVAKQQQAATRAIEAKVIDALATYIVKSPYTKTSNGFTESGTIAQLEQALAPTISSIEHRSPKVTKVPGTYTFKLSTSGTTVTGLSVSISTTSATIGTVSATLTAKVTHDAVPIAAPTGATVITPQLLHELQSSA